MSKPMFRTKVSYASTNKINKNLLRWGDKLYDVVKMIIDLNFIEGENFAKQNAPWTDRTGDARRSIASVDLSEKGVVRYHLIIGVDYGIWLEVSNQGKYRILVPTLSIMEARIIKALNRIGVEVKRA